MKIINTEVWGFKHAFKGMRNPLNSWNKSDSYNGFHNDEVLSDFCYASVENEVKTSYVIGEADLELAQRLIRSGNEHGKFMRMIHVSADIDMPRYWWSEEDTYHFNTKNSCSTMHKLLNNDNPITLDMFLICEEDIDVWEVCINRLEQLRQEYKALQKATDCSAKSIKMNRLLVRAKRLLNEGFLQLRTLDTNYAELRTGYFQRRNHRLKEEWIDVWCKWVESLPYSAELITYEPNK